MDALKMTKKHTCIEGLQSVGAAEKHWRGGHDICCSGTRPIPGTRPSRRHGDRAHKHVSGVRINVIESLKIESGTRRC